MLRISSAAILVLSATGAVWARQQPADRVRQNLPPGAVTVFHSVDIAKLMRRMKLEHGVDVGLMMPAGRNPINITTGLIVDRAGHVITRLLNLDPEDKDQDITVRISDGSQFKARLVGIDCPTGFAILEVAAGRNLDPALTAAGSVEEGAEVKLFNTDLDHNTTISNGVIRFSTEVTTLDGKIAAGTLFSRARSALTLLSIGLTPKNDSGIVETLDNKLVGMAQWAGLASGMAYVFPYEFLRGQVLARVLDRNGTVPSGWLGVVAEIPAAGSPRGVVVKEIQPQSTADLCGLQAKDVIVGLDQFEITGQAEMAAVLSALPAGRKVRLRALRDQRPLEIEAVLGAQQIRPIIDRWPAGLGNSQPFPPITDEKLAVGFVARDITTQLASYFGVENGTLVTEVSKGSPAEKAGLAAGDIVVAAYDQEVRSVQELKSLLSARPGTIKLKVYRNKTSRAVDILSSN
jgi:serine protease Do